MKHTYQKLLQISLLSLILTGCQSLSSETGGKTELPSEKPVESTSIMSDKKTEEVTDSPFESDTSSATEEEKTEIDKVEETENNIIPILGGTSGVVIFLGGLLLFMKNVKVYNYQNGKWTYIGKALLLKGKLRLDKFRSKEVTNKYRIELSKNLTKKYKDKTITIYKGTNSIKKIVHTSDDKIDFEVRI